MRTYKVNFDKVETLEDLKSIFKLMPIAFEAESEEDIEDIKHLVDDITQEEEGGDCCGDPSGCSSCG